jgi:hypothetical protein
MTPQYISHKNKAVGMVEPLSNYRIELNALPLNNQTKFRNRPSVHSQTIEQLEGFRDMVIMTDQQAGMMQAE